MDNKVASLLQSINQSNPPCGFHVGDGWFPIVADALRKIAVLNVDWTLEQVKQKFCGLRIYFSLSKTDMPRYDEIRAIVANAEEVCATICEDCGALHYLETPCSGMALCEECRAA